MAPPLTEIDDILEDQECARMAMNIVFVFQALQADIMIIYNIRPLSFNQITRRILPATLTSCSIEILCKIAIFEEEKDTANR